MIIQLVLLYIDTGHDIDMMNLCCHDGRGKRRYVACGDLVRVWLVRHSSLVV